MRPALWASLAALLLAGGCGGTEDQEDVGVPPTMLTIAVQAQGPEGPRTDVILHCDPPGGTHPRPDAACATLFGNLSALDPVPGDVACTEIFGGPERAVVRGTIVEPGSGDEREADARLSRSNGCEIERWDRLGPLLDLR